jgi:hypothetical protein
VVKLAGRADLRAFNALAGENALFFDRSDSGAELAAVAVIFCLFQPAISARVLMVLRTSVVATKPAPSVPGASNLSETFSILPRDIVSPRTPKPR